MFHYMHWADRTILDASASVPDDAYHAPRGVSHGSIHALLVHCMAGQSTWLARWNGDPKPPLQNETDFPTRDALTAHWPKVHQSLFDFLDAQSDESLQRRVEGRNYWNEPFSLPLGATMLHVVDHATYHRGQLNSMLKQAGATPTVPYLHRYLALNP